MGQAEGQRRRPSGPVRGTSRSRRGSTRWPLAPAQEPARRDGLRSRSNRPLKAPAPQDERESASPSSAVLAHANESRQVHIVSIELSVHNYSLTLWLRVLIIEVGSPLPRCSQEVTDGLAG